MADDVSETPERWLTIEQARVEIGVSRRTIYNWLKVDARLTAKRTAGGSVRILASSLWRDASSKTHGVAVPN